MVIISRKCTRLLGGCFQLLFGRTSYGPGTKSFRLLHDALYDFLYDHEFPSWFCNVARSLKRSDERSLPDFIQRLHTGESIPPTPEWTWKQREQLGRQLIMKLADTYFRFIYDNSNKLSKRVNEEAANLMSELELSGFTWVADHLVAAEEDVIEPQEQQGVLSTLWKLLVLPDVATLEHHLANSETQYVGGKWDDCISNSRKVLEGVLQQSASVHHMKSAGSSLPEAQYSKPVAVRDYLESANLLDTKEKKAIAEIYGLLSNTGGHPYIAEKDQARLMRHLALALSQFVMLRLKGYLKL